MKPLDPVALDLQQNSLIEASAGTGKTYTITTLYLRAILGLLSPEGELQPVDIKKILVVTFTDAATKELKSRLRAKLLEAQDVLLSLSAKLGLEDPELSLGNAEAQQIADIGFNIDPTLSTLFDQYEHKCAVQFGLTKPEAFLKAFNLIQHAILFIDESSVFTIHGFCQRCLTQFAFETQSDFERKMELDYLPAQEKALYDFWRKHAVGLTGLEFELFSQLWRSPESLHAEIKSILGKPIAVSPEISKADYEIELKRYQQKLEQVRQQWNALNFSAVIQESGLNKRLKAYKNLALLTPFLSGDVIRPHFTDSERWESWGSSILADQSKYSKNKMCIVSPIIKLIDELAELEQAFVKTRFKAYWLGCAKQNIEALMKQGLSEQQIITPDDLLTSLQAAVAEHDNEALLAMIRQSYPLAFIDEFQDTDPVQYTIFSSIYQPDGPDHQANMILIGDPKQAIYKFRGADIYTYIRAKTAIHQARHFTLTKNYRSHPELISSVNYLFEHSQLQFEHDAIPFMPVTAGRTFSPESIPLDRETGALEVGHLILQEDNKKGISSKEGDLALAKWCVLDMVSQLKKNSRLTTGDMCILVRNRGQAKLIKSCLKQVGLDSVYLSRDGIFKSYLAKHLYLVLSAVVAPHKEQLIKTALATSLFPFNEKELLRIQKDPNRWQEKLNWFFDAHSLLQHGNIAQSIELLLNQANTYHYWAEHDVEFHRNVTDLRHLLEVLQLQKQKLDGLEKLLLWFEQQLVDDEDTENNEEKVLRLETDSQLIKIITYHASKGLEYPYVYLPFLANGRIENKAIYTSERQNQTFYRADNRELELQLAEQERLAEDLRLLYVSLTRPIYRLAIGIYNVTGRNINFNKTAIGRLLFAKTPLENVDAMIDQYFQQMAMQIQGEQSAGVMYHQFTQEQVDTAFLAQTADPVTITTQPRSLGPQPELEISPKEEWRIISYSMLSKQLGHQTLSSVAAETPVSSSVDNIEIFAKNSVEIEHFSAELTPSANTETVYDQFHFPKGANAGTCLHAILENINFQIPLAEQTETIQKTLAKYAIAQEWTDVVINWMQNVVDNSSSGFALKTLDNHHFINEMEFYFDFSHLSQSVIGNALSMMGLSSLSAKAHKALIHAARGVVKGYIDVVVESRGQFYVLDYKSNYIGDEFADYEQKNLQENMIEHHYHLQALIYLLALHRFLKIRIANYNYETHIGGALYWYLRGMQVVGNNGVFHINVKLEVIEYLDNALLGGADFDSVTREQNDAIKSQRNQELTQGNLTGGRIDDLLKDDHPNEDKETHDKENKSSGVGTQTGFDF